jgi:hypothetical protein
MNAGSATLTPTQLSPFTHTSAGQHLIPHIVGGVRGRSISISAAGALPISHTHTHRHAAVQCQHQCMVQHPMQQNQACSCLAVSECARCAVRECRATPSTSRAAAVLRRHPLQQQHKQRQAAVLLRAGPDDSGAAGGEGEGRGGARAAHTHAGRATCSRRRTLLRAAPCHTDLSDLMKQDMARFAAKQQQQQQAAGASMRAVGGVSWSAECAGLRHRAVVRHSVGNEWNVTSGTASGLKCHVVTSMLLSLHCCRRPNQQRVAAP